MSCDAAALWSAEVLVMSQLFIGNAILIKEFHSTLVLWSSTPARSVFLFF